MAEVDILVNARQYKVACEDGQERRLQDLARHLNTHVSALADELGQIGEERLLLLAALTICDELFEEREKGAIPTDGAQNPAELLEETRARVNKMRERLSAAG